MTFSQVLDVLILLLLTFGFVTFTAAIAVEFVGPLPLPWWARSCVSGRRGANIRQHVAGTFIFIVLAMSAGVIALSSLATAIAGRELVVAAASLLALIVMVVWLASLRRRYLAVSS
jgi:hypothetical protein